MKIIKSGDPLRLLPWFTINIQECGKCGCTFKLEPSDRVRGEVDDQLDGHYAYVDCPFCGKQVIVS